MSWMEESLSSRGYSDETIEKWSWDAQNWDDNSDDDFDDDDEDEDE